MSAPALNEAEIEGLAGRAVRVVAGTAPLLLLCEHGGNTVPAPWRDLGLAPGFLDTHFAFDRGAATLTEALAARLSAPAVLASYSRLYLDLNRFMFDWECVRPDMGGIPVPGNLDVDDAERGLRTRISREPFDRAVEAELSGRPAVVSVHSFTPVFSGKRRTTEIGVLWRAESRLGPPVLAALSRQKRYEIDDNEPYDWNDTDGYTLRRHGLDRGLSCLYIEVRSDLIETPDGVGSVADVLAPALAEATGLAT